MWLDARIDEQGAAAAPVLVLHKGTNPVQVVGRVGSREGYPKEVI